VIGFVVTAERKSVQAVEPAMVDMAMLLRSPYCNRDCISQIVVNAYS
jgi:hypothetical protein